jgi:hypothetical protein
MRRANSVELAQYQLSDAAWRGVMHVYGSSRGQVLPPLPMRASGLQLEHSDDAGVAVLRLASNARSGVTILWDEWEVEHDVLLRWVRYVNAEDLRDRVAKYRTQIAGIQNAYVLDEAKRTLCLQFRDVAAAHVFETTLGSMSVEVVDHELDLHVTFPWTCPRP